jgi:hypothetical protein
MHLFRPFLLIVWLSIAGYTAIVGANHGLNLLPIFFGDIASMTWPGQFNLDFLCMLLLSGLWVSWRHQFSPAGLALGILAVFGGAFFLSLYLLVVSHRLQGGMQELLLGKSRAVG